jgi:hypothetical protein
MAYKFIGYQPVDLNTDDGKHIKGYSLFFIKSFSESEAGKGWKFLLPNGRKNSCFVNEDEFHSLNLEIGKHYQLFFNERGFISKDMIKPVE